MRAAEGGQRNEVQSRSNLDLAPSSELRYLGRSASRQSSLPINRDCQQTATNYLLYQSRTYTEHQIFLAFHKLLKRYMKAQQLVQCMVPRALFGGVWIKSKSVYSSGSQLLLSRPSVSGAYLKKLLGCGSFVRGRKRKKGDSIPFILPRRDYMPRLPAEATR